MGLQDIVIAVVGFISDMALGISSLLSGKGNVDFSGYGLWIFLGIVGCVMLIVYLYNNRHRFEEFYDEYE